MPARIAWLLLLGAAIACSDRGPTSPVASGIASASESAAARGPAKGSSTRAIDSRGGAVPSLQGVWGGEGIALTITAYGASVEYDCSAGSIDQVFAPDASGHFDLQGTWWFTPPVLFVDWKPEKRSARYVGVLNGTSVKMTVIRLDDNLTLNFHLVQNTAPRLHRCL